MNGDEQKQDLEALLSELTGAATEETAATTAAAEPAAPRLPNEPAPPVKTAPVKPAAPPDGSIQLLLDVPLQLTVELGRAERPMRDVLALAPGSVVELNRLAGEPVDVMVNGHLIARAEVVVVDESFGVRITEIVDPKDRIHPAR